MTRIPDNVNVVASMKEVLTLRIDTPNFGVHYFVRTLIKTFSSFASSLILNDDEAAWNLAYLSYDFEKLRSHPDPHFSTHVRRTLQHVLLTGETDLAGKVPAHLTVRGFFRFPPPKAMFQLLAMKRREALPLFKAYGTGWLVLAEQRSHLWQEPYDSALDALVTELSHLAQKRW